MQETPAEPMGGGSTASAPASTPEQPAATPAPTPTATPAPTPAPAGPDYLGELAHSVVSQWDAPRRDRSVPPRLGTAVIRFRRDGSVLEWRWRRRSPDGPFNASVADFLDNLEGSGQTFALPPAGTPERREAVEEGVLVEFADPDA